MVSLDLAIRRSGRRWRSSTRRSCRMSLKWFPLQSRRRRSGRDPEHAGAGGLRSSAPPPPTACAWRWRRTRSEGSLDRAVEMLQQTRPTAVNLRWALDEMTAAVRGLPEADRRMRRGRRRRRSVMTMSPSAVPSVSTGTASSVRSSAEKSGAPLNVLTHCNAGWLATVRLGDRARADLRCARCGHRGPRLGR